VILSEAIRDPVHRLIRLEREDLPLLDGAPVQRLRSISQLGLTDRVYPGARHSRFEHALGTLEVATMLLEEMRARLGLDALLGPLGLPESEDNWDQLVRMARLVALLHDIGHAPFSHVSEGLLPSGGHEQMTLALLEHPAVADHLRQRGDAICDAVMRILDPTDLDLPPHLRFVRSLVCGRFGADRMDYLLRDSHCLGVQYGCFDLPRILHTLTPVETTDGVRLGIERGGVLAAEGLQWARFSMFTQVYFHHTRRILDRHLINFLRVVIPEGRYPQQPEEYLHWDDHRVLGLLQQARRDTTAPGHLDACRILDRKQHRAVGDIVEGSDVEDVTRRLTERCKELLLGDPDLDPIIDVVEPPPDLDAGAALPVLLENQQVRSLGEISALVGRLRVKPYGRIYCSRVTQPSG